MSYAENVMIIHPRFFQWGGSRHDKQKSREIANQFGASAELVKLTKKLCNSPELAAIINFHQKVRQHVYHETLPWFDNGGRILQAVRFATFSAKWREYKNEAEMEVYPPFLRVYADLVSRDRQLLNGLYDSNDYPTEEGIKYRFGMRLIVSPLPQATDFRVHMANDDMEEIRAELERRTEEAFKASIADLFRRLIDENTGPLRKMANTLKEPDKIFRDSLVFNLSSLVRHLGSLNFTGDAELSAMLKEIENSLCSLSPDVLRNDPQVREIVAEEAQEKVEEIEKKISSFNFF